MTQGTLFAPSEVCPCCKREGGDHVAGCNRGPQPKAVEATDRSPAQRQQILELLRRAGPAGVTNADLNAICFRYGARIFELRKMGHKIKTLSGRGSPFRFVLEA